MVNSGNRRIGCICIVKAGFSFCGCDVPDFSGVFAAGYTKSLACTFVPVSLTQIATS
jgi:hypothetical protein